MVECSGVWNFFLAKQALFDFNIIDIEGWWNLRTNHSVICLCSFEYVQNMHFFETTWKSWQRVQILDIFCTGRNHRISNIFEDLSVDLARSEFLFNSFTLKMFEWKENILGYDLHAYLSFATKHSTSLLFGPKGSVSLDGKSTKL